MQALPFLPMSVTPTSGRPWNSVGLLLCQTNGSVGGRNGGVFMGRGTKKGKKSDRMTTLPATIRRIRHFNIVGPGIIRLSPPRVFRSPPAVRNLPRILLCSKPQRVKFLEERTTAAQPLVLGGRLLSVLICLFFWTLLRLTH